MLTAEDDLIDAYARGELTGDERGSFENSFIRSLSVRDRIHFARAFACEVSATPLGPPKLPITLLNIFKAFQSPGLLRTATIATVIVSLAVLAWLVNDRRRMTNELRELRAESAKLGKQAETLFRSSDIAQTRSAELTGQLEGLRTQPEKPRHPGRRTNRERSVAARRGHKATITLDDGTTIRGTAKDPNGNVVSGATVTLTNSAGNFTRTQSTNKDGTYIFNAIPQGTYSIQIKASGFKTASVSGLAARVDTPIVLDLQLEVGDVSERVDVTSAAVATVNSQDATLGDTFVSKRITQLPLEVREVPNLLTLQTATTRDGSVAGTRADQCNITFDGLEVFPPDTYSLILPNANNRGETTIHVANSLSSIRFQITLESAAIHEDYILTIKTADGRYVTTVSWIEPLTPNQTIIDTPLIQTVDLPSGDYVLLLMGKEPDGSFVKVAERSLKVIRYQ